MPSCTWKVIKRGKKGKKDKVVEACHLEAQTDSAYCPRHTFLHNLSVQREHEKDRAKRLQASEEAIAKRGPRTRIQHQQAGYLFQGSSVCRCGKRIEWWRTPNNANAPYNPMPEETSPAVSHFATCSQRQQFRKAS